MPDKQLPRIHALRPAVMELEAGDYWWCSCGLSGHQPMCDGEHTGTGLRSKKFTLTAKAIVRLCNCKRTGTPPYCDGAHARIQPSLEGEGQATSGDEDRKPQ